MREVTRYLVCFVTCFFLLSIHSVFAQNRTITGTITAEDTKKPVAGATVTAKGTNLSVITDGDGHFKIAISEKIKILVISFTGYQQIEIAVTDKNSYTAELQIDNKALEDVVVIGYQTVKRKDLTASVSSVSAKDLRNDPGNNAAQALAGRLAGVQVTTSEGAPGADVDIYVRGRNSITQSGSPLYIVDGIQVENALNLISPQDIQSIDVLKDAASTAIYGARGSNGVVLITTKSGRAGGKTTVNYNAFVGYNKISRKLDMMNVYDFVLYTYERAAYTQNPTDTAVAAQYIKRMSNFDTLANTYMNYDGAFDWQEQMMGRDAMQTTHNVSVNGGTAATQYNLSLTYNKQEGLLLNSDYERKLITFKFDHAVSKKLKVGFNVRYNLQDVLGAGTSDVGGAGSNRLRQYVRYRPLILPGQAEDYYDADLDARNPGNGLNELNPLLVMNAEYRKRTLTAYNFGGYFNYTLAKNLSLRSTFGYNLQKTESRGYDDTLTGNSRSNARLPLITMNNVDLLTMNNSNVITYSNSSFLKTKQSLDILVGHEIYTTTNKTNAFEIRYFPVGIKPEVAFANLGLAAPPAGLVQPKPSSSEVQTNQVSLFSRINYGILNKRYLLTINLRADGSSLFGPDFSSPIPPKDPTNRKWGYFPSAAVAWRFSQEKFMKNVSFINDGKLRISYGSAGNNRIQAYGFTTGYAPPSNGGYGVNDVLNYTLTLPNRLGNPLITWETTTSKNLGLDLGMFNSRLNLTVDAYSNVTEDLLLENKIPPTSGYTTQYQNVGKVRNNGVEFQLNGAIIKKKDFNWNASFNIAFVRNKILSLGNQQKFTANSGWFSSTANPDDYILRVGDAVGTMYGLKVEGFYKPFDFTVNKIYNPNYPNLTWQYTLNSNLANPASVLADLVAPGQIKYLDANNDGKVTLDSDRVVIGHALPKFTGGFNQQFSWKGFDLNIFMNFCYGNDIMNSNKLEFSTAYGVDINMLNIMKDRWKVINQNGVLIQKQVNSTTVISISPDSLEAMNANAKIWQPIRTTTGFFPSSFAVEDGSFLRINNITLGYTLPSAVTKRFKMDNLRLYFTIYNVGTITGYSGYDPDVNARRGSVLTPGVDYAAYPRGRTFLAGLNVTF